jgi:putative DNA primase/helicase
MHNGHIERARQALHAIPPDLPRDEWVIVGMAAQAAELGFEDFNEWSAGAVSYKERDARAAWRSFKLGKGVGAGTLFKLAHEHGVRRDGPAGRPYQSSPGKPAERPLPPAQPPRPGMSAAEVWARCKPATAEHGYIVAKQGKPDGLRVVPDGDPLRIAEQSVAGRLVVPVVPLAGGGPVSLQFIPPLGVGKKLNLPGAPVSGVFIVGDLLPGGVVYLCEGIGQAWACWKATGHAAVVCFGWGRVRALAAELRKRDASAELVLVPDVGKEAEAEPIAREVRGACATMPSGWAQNADVNDYAKREGFDALEALLHRAKASLANGVVLVNGADLTPQPVAWLWRDWLALGKLHILAGAPGHGKTTIALAMAATVTCGGRWPDGSRSERGHVLMWSGEDDPADTLLPRLIAAGADKTRVHFVSGTRTNGELAPFDPAYDMAQLET